MLIEAPIEFTGDSFIELDKEAFFKDSQKFEQEFQLKLSTQQSNGLIMWREDLNPPDRTELKTEHGHLIYRFD